jgi:hypothetical protein
MFFSRFKMVSGRAAPLFQLCVIVSWQQEADGVSDIVPDSSQATSDSTVLDRRPFISNSGWVTYPSDLLVPPGPCNIDIRDKTLTQQEFLAQYAYSRPVVIRDAADNDLFRALTER